MCEDTFEQIAEGFCFLFVVANYVSRNVEVPNALIILSKFGERERERRERGRERVVCWQAGNYDIICVYLVS